MSDRRFKDEVRMSASKTRAQMFLSQEVKILVDDLENTFRLEVESLGDDDIASRKDDIPKQLERMATLSKMMHELLECSNPDLATEIDEIVKKYDYVSVAKNRYCQSINEEATERELSKLQLFNESKLNISLPKFSGYDSKIDIYSFQSELMKIHKRTTPRRVMPDLLKNNLLEGAALALVSSVTNIDDIWQRLKSGYGDPKLLLKKKISEISTISQLWKLKDPDTNWLRH